MREIVVQKATPSEEKSKVLSGPDSASTDLRFQLAHDLQSSLDLRETLSQFFTKARSLVKFSSITFVNPQKRLDVTLGSLQKHQAEYTLVTEAYNLGTLIFSRDKRFSEVELQGLEMLTGLLFFPLRNALLYREALDNSLRDTLTQVGNRAAMEMALKREIELAKRNNQPLCLLVLDVDHFKSINDSLGHQLGDKMLAHIATVTRESLRQTDQVFRFGGEEFVVLLSDTPLPAAQMVANRIRVGIDSVPLNLDGQDFTATVSIGLACLTADDDRESLFQRADAALYRAKHQGRNRVVSEHDHLSSATPQSAWA
jgi:diguanylate cyclase (GGDEF)-like protein